MFRFTVILSVVLLSVFSAAARGDDTIVWRPITAEEMQMSKPNVEPDADAEAIFWEVRLDDKKLDSVYFEHYVRVKIFTERGREQYSKFDIPFIKGKKIENIAARVIRRDGTIVDLNPNDIFEREIIKAGKIKVMAKSFAVPSIEPGVIVEYQYRETYKDAWSNGIRLEFQRDIPVERLTYHVRPQSGLSLQFKYYNMQETKFVADPTEKGFFVATVANVPAYKVEPYMPPEDEVRRWAYMQYGFLPDVSPPWGSVLVRYQPWLTVYAKPNEAIKSRSAELTANAKTDDEKLRSIYDYVQKQIRNVDYDPSITEKEREKLELKHASDAIKRGMANTIYLKLLFASLAQAAGYEVGLVFSGDRSDNFFNPDRYPFSRFLHLAGVAVSVQNETKFFNPGVPYIPYGFLTWNEEASTAMLISEKGYFWVKTPLADYTRSRSRRTAKITLSEDGTLEGSVRVEYYGHQAMGRRRDLFRASPAKREESITEELKGRMSGIEVSNVAIENFEDSSAPLVYSYKFRMPNYAQRTGKRLFLQPGFFEFGIKPVFSSDTRINSVVFPYPWSEEDDIEIQLPKGFELDSADQPAEVADPKKVGLLQVQIGIDRAHNVLKYRRNFHFGGERIILFPVNLYKPLKAIFDSFSKADAHIVTLKQSGS